MENEPTADSAVQDIKCSIADTKPSTPNETEPPILENGDVKQELEEIKEAIKENEDENQLEEETTEDKKVAAKRKADSAENESVPKKKLKKSNSVVNGDVKEASFDEPDDEIDSESDEEISKPRRRGRCKKNPEQIPAHLAPDIALGYRILLKFLETPQFSGFLRPGSVDSAEDDENASEQITCLNQIKKKFDDNSYKKIEDFVADVREMLSSIYTTQGNSAAVKRALRLEQVLEQRIAQLPNYLRPQCALNLSPDEISNSPKKIRINKGGGFVSLLLERAEKLRVEKDKEKRKVLAEERKQLKEEQDKDVQEWEKGVLLKDHEEEIKSMWELPQIGHFIHLCANILNIGDVSQYEVERMLLMPQCSETLDLLITALLSNSLVRAKLDRTPSMPYSIWLPQVRTRVNAWYRAYHREYGNAQKVFEEIGVEPEFFDVCGKAHSPLDYFFFHEIPLIQRVWIIKTLCDVDFVRKKTVYDNIRNQLLEELQGTNLGVDRHGNRYIHFPQFGMTAVRIYRQTTLAEEGISPSDLIESQEGFEERKGEITLDKVFRDIWDVGKKEETPAKRGRRKKKKGRETVSMKVKIEPTGPKNLRQSARAKRKIYVDSTDSDGSDTDLATLKSKLDDQNKAQNTPISLTVFRLPREKVKPLNTKKSYYCRKLEREEAERLRLEEEREAKDKPSPEDEDASESMEPKLEDEEDEDAKDNFTIKNLENLKMVLKKEPEDNDNARDGMTVKEEDKFKYNTPAHLLPDRSKFYCVVDSVDGLRQLISQFASDDNDLEIINRSTLRSGRKTGSKLPESPSCEVQLIERLQTLVDDLEEWEMDFIKASRTIREKLYKEYTNFLNRPEDFVHPNEAYWQAFYEEPPPPVPQQPTPDPEPTPDEKPAILPETPNSTAPPSPLGSLRPRTRTRQQATPVIKTEDPEIDEEYQEEELESSESDDNWEMPTRKRNRRPPERLPVPTPRQSKRMPKRNSRYSPGSDSSDKSKPFWASQCSDPSEELNWEANRQKILERHNSPRKGDSDNVTPEMENSMKHLTPIAPKSRTAIIPGNKKPYYSAAQISAMNKKKDNNVSASKLNATPKTTTSRQGFAQRVGKQLFNKKIIAQINAPVAKKPVVITSMEEYYITDGTSYIKIESSLVSELLNKHENIQQFRDRLDLTKKIEIVKKKIETTTTAPAATAAANQATSEAQQQQLQASPSKPSNLRFIRPQLVPSQVQFIRPQHRMPTQQANIVYVQTTQPQNFVQVPTSVRPTGLVQMITRPAVSQEAATSTMVFQQTKPEDGNGNPVDIVSLLGSGGGYIQVPAGAKQPLQFVQLSQANTQTGLTGQSVYRIATSSVENQTVSSPSFVRIASTGQIVQLSQAPGAMAFKPQQQTQSVAQPVVSAPNQVNLVQVQGLPGEPISYIPLPPGMKPMSNIVQIQSPIKSSTSMGTLVQVATPTRQQTPVQRLVQVQPRATVQTQRPLQMAATRPQMVSPTSTAKPQTTLVQVYGTPRMQTTMTPHTRPPQVVQVRPQDVAKATTATAPQTSPRARLIVPSTIQSTTILQSALRQTSPRLIVNQSGQQRLQAAPTIVAAAANTPRAAVTTATQIRPQRPIRVQGPSPKAQTSPIRQAIRAAGTNNTVKPITAQVVQMPLADGKPGYFQLQNSAGQAMGIVQVVTSGQSTNASPTSLSVQTSILSQGKQQTAISPGNFIQIQQPSVSTPNHGLVQLQSVRPQFVQMSGNAATRPSVARPVSPNKQVYSIQMAEPEDNSIKMSAPGTLRLVSSGQTLRLVTTDSKSGQTVALQPMMVRTSGSKPVMSTGNKIVATQAMKIESEEISKEASPVVDSVDIIRGEMSIKETESGTKFIVKTAMGQDYVLNNSQIEARKAANDGRI